MAQAWNAQQANVAVAPRTPSVVSRPAYQAYVLLHIGYAILPIVVGIDKFLHKLVDWDLYLSPTVAKLLPFNGHTFMLISGGVEIAAGLLVAFRPRIGAYVVTLWLLGIVVNLLFMPNFYDVALRDFGLALGALALARLSREFNSRPLGP